MATFQQRRNDLREKPTFKIREEAKETKPMTDEEIKTAIQIMSSFRCLEVGQTAMRLFAPRSFLPHYGVILYDDQSFDLFGKDLKTRCFEGQILNGPKFKSYADRRIVAYAYDPTIWDGRKIVPTAGQIEAWFQKYPMFKHRGIYGLAEVLTVATLNELPWFNREYMELFYDLVRFDHTYDYSDDINTWRAGNKRHKELTDKILGMEHGLELARWAPRFVMYK